MENFIHQGYLPNLDICDKLIEFHKNSNNKLPGNYGSSMSEEFKKSTDVNLKENEKLFLEYDMYLKDVVEEYIELFPYCNYYSPWRNTEIVRVQHYSPGEAYYGWHCERTTKMEPYNSRHLVYMTYLNDVTDAGETEFYHQQLKIQPKKGLTLIWPADWTYTHRGIPSNTQEKYIVTGWFNYTS